jgi:hypothetical protein
MQTISMRRANELGSEARGAVETLLGRKVADEEHVTVMAFPAEGVPDPRSIDQLIEDLDSLAASGSHVPGDEMEGLIDEAIRHALGRRP